MGTRDFGAEIAKILPYVLREFAGRQRDLFIKIALTVPQMVILDFLMERGPCKMSELAEALNFTMSAVTAIVDKMIKTKLVKRERSAQDRRVVRVVILHKGVQAARRVKETRRSCANEMFSVLSEQEKNEYVRILRKVADNLRKKK